MLVEACLTQILPPVAREPSPEELRGMTVAGNTFVYKQTALGFQWNDHYPWKVLKNEDLEHYLWKVLKNEDLQISMSVPLDLCKITARVHWQGTIYLFVSYQALPGSVNGLQSPRVCENTWKLTIRDGLEIQ